MSLTHGIYPRPHIFGLRLFRKTLEKGEMMAKARRGPYHVNVIAENTWTGLGSAAGLVDRSRAACKAGDPAVMRHQLGRLRAALRKERARGRAGHGSYDLARHLMLSQAVQAAEAALTQTVPAR